VNENGIIGLDGRRRDWKARKFLSGEDYTPE